MAVTAKLLVAEDDIFVRSMIAEFLRDAGFAPRARAMKIDEGIAMIADLVHPAIGLPRLYIDPRCQHLITAMESYERGADGRPIKDGAHDHLIDALRYAIVNHEDCGAAVDVRYY